MIMKTWIKYLFIIVNILILCIWVWFRFVKERIPREIPFNLSLLNTILLLLICLNYVYAIYRLIVSLEKIKKKSAFNLDHIKKFINDILKELKTSIIFTFYYHKSLTYLIINLDSYAYLLSVIHYIIRIFLLVILLLDIYANKLFFTYKFIYLYLIIYLIQIFIYLCKTMIQDRIFYLNQNIVTREGSFGHFHDLRELINKLTILKQQKKPPLSYSLWLSDFFIDEAIQNLKKTYDKPRLDVKKAKEEFQLILDFTINTNNFIYTYYLLQRKDRILDLIITILYTFCWFYILFISLSTFQLINVDLIFLTTFQDIYEPFSNLILNISHES